MCKKNNSVIIKIFSDIDKIYDEACGGGFNITFICVWEIFMNYLVCRCGTLCVHLPNISNKRTK